MKLSEILQGAQIKGKYDKDLNIKGIASDSRKIKDGYVFVAIKGEKRNGNDYISQAISNGCIIIISDDENKKDENVLITDNARRTLSIIWHNYYNNPDKDMKVVAITGTNGKTSTAFFLYNIISKSGEKCGLISTVKCMIDNDEYSLDGGSEVSDISSAMTTPDPEKLYKVISLMKEHNIKYLVMEASSHSLSQEKLYPLHIDIAVFTNLSDEHLDFHKSKEEYFKTKSKLFQKPILSIINFDDEYGKRLSKNIASKKVMCSVQQKADYYVENSENTDTGLSFLLKYDEKAIDIKSSICGEYNVYNSMIASACALELGFSAENVKIGIESTKTIDGRLEKVCGRNIYIDYAHTPVAMEKVILSVRNFLPNKKITVLFGCGGDRDKGKRQNMGKIASNLCDKIILTSDNSRSEDPLSIIEEIKKGISDSSNYVVIPKREDAIKYAIREFSQSDVLLLLGKGHENYEIDKTGKHYFSEKEIIEAEIKKYDK